MIIINLYYHKSEYVFHDNHKSVLCVETGLYFITTIWDKGNPLCKYGVCPHCGKEVKIKED